MLSFSLPIGYEILNLEELWNSTLKELGIPPYELDINSLIQKNYEVRVLERQGREASFFHLICFVSPTWRLSKSLNPIYILGQAGQKVEAVKQLGALAWGRKDITCILHRAPTNHILGHPKTQGWQNGHRRGISLWTTLPCPSTSHLLFRWLLPGLIDTTKLLVLSLPLTNYWPR